MFDERQPEKHELRADLAALEKQLAGLAPVLPRIDRDRLMFEAGQAVALAKNEPSPGPSLRGRGEIAATLRVAGGRHWFWPAATATMTAASLVLATMLVWQRQTTLIAQQASRQAPATAAADPPRVRDVDSTRRFATHIDGSWKVPQPTSGYLGVRYVALTRGVGAIEPQFTAANGNSDSPIDRPQSQPTTPRGLLDDLLPPADASKSTRS